MKITRLEQQRTKKDRYNLFVDDNFVSGISINLISDFDLYEGKEVDRKTLLEVSEENELTRAKTKILDYYSRRMHSEKELEQKLRGKFSKEVISKAIGIFIDLGYIDDKRFAEAWTESRIRTKGKRVIRIELKQKGISEDIIKNIAENIDPEDEYKRALGLVRKKTWPEMNKKERFTKIGGFLARRGFDYDLIKQVLKETE